MTDPNQIQIPPGICVTTTYGSLAHETYLFLSEMRSFSEKNGLQNVLWMTVPGGLVEKARNDAVREMLKRNLQWILFVDGDMTGSPDSLIRQLQIAYGSMPHADVLGGWCPLRGDLALPTIDTGTGTWESHFPGSGVMEVIRTGGAFLLCKRHCFERIPEPWFRLRVPARPLDFMAEVDNWSRIKNDGVNVFRNLPGEPWEKLEELARTDPSAATFTPAEVGEDSGFCDRARNAGLRIFVNTDVHLGHVDRRVLTWETHAKAIEESHAQQRMLSGLLA